MSEKKLRSISVFIPVVCVSLEKIGFVQTDSATMSSDGKFWKKMLYVKGEETISVSDELGDLTKRSYNINMWFTQYN